jgi:hypothetical protein
MAHGGDLQKIALGMQIGTINPTVGALAATLKKHMMAQAQTAQAPTQTVAQQLFNPLTPQPSVAQQVMGGVPQAPGAVPPGGLGMTPPAPPPMAPGMAPPMGAPPAPPMGDMPMGMADGGLAMLPIPETMFDEPMDGSYAGGGIVSFSTGSPGTLSAAPDNLFGYSSNPMALVEEYRRLYQPKTEASERAKKLYNEVVSEEGQEKSRKQGLNAFLMDFGAALAGETGPLLSAAGKAGRKTLPGYQENVKERRAEQREAIRQLALDEGASNAEARREADLYMQGKGRFAELAQAEKTRQFEREKFEGQQELGYAQIAAQERASRAAAAARDNLDFTEKNAEIIYQQLKARNDRLPYYKGTAKFFDKNQYQRTDQALRAEAYERAAKMRYFSPADNPLTTTRAGLLASMVDPDGGGAGQDTVNLGPIVKPS